jgi:hypothetical protein
MPEYQHAATQADEDQAIRRGAGAAWIAACIATDAVCSAELAVALAARHRRAKTGAETGTGPSQSR